jgi:hypothetical protein
MYVRTASERIVIGKRYLNRSTSDSNKMMDTLEIVVGALPGQIYRFVLQESLMQDVGGFTILIRVPLPHFAQTTRKHTPALAPLKVAQKSSSLEMSVHKP